MKTLIIAEKPSVAKDIAAALGGFSQPSRDYFERDDLIVSSAVGHVATLDVPEAKSSPPLPIIPEKFSIEPIEKAKSRLFMLRDLIKRKDVGSIVNACDAGREGELIFHRIAAYVGTTKPMYRMWMQSMTADAIRSAHKTMQSAEKYAGLLDAALCRAESDWLVGINGSRALGQFLRQTVGEVKTSSVGRVQTPTLALIVHRELAIKNFIPEPYFEVLGTFKVKAGAYLGKWQQRQNQQNKANKAVPEEGAENQESPESSSSRLTTKAAAQAIIERCQASLNKHPDCIQVSEQSKPALKNAHSLFDLTTLQREANKRFGFTAADTLKLAQALYETHKVLSYPRTDSNALPEDYPNTAQTILSALAGSTASSGTGFDVYQQLAQTVLDKNWVDGNKTNKRIFNNAKISDHFAIIPTGQHAANLNEFESKIYDLVVRRFLAVFYPAAEYLKTTRITSIADDAFYSAGSVLKVPGWLSVYSANDSTNGGANNHGPESNGTSDESSGDGNEGNNSDSLLTAIAPKETVSLKSLDAKALKTKPPAYYNEASLLGAMENASGEITDDDEAKKAMSAKGLGTPATRAATIEGLVFKEYIKRAEKQIRPTDRALYLIPILEKLELNVLTSAKTTGEWEHRLALMEKGGYARANFMSEIANTTRMITSVFAGHAKTTRPTNPCPDCGSALMRRESKQKKGQFYWSCSGYPKCKTLLTDAKGKPGEKKVAAVASTEHLCPDCGKGLVLRKGINKKTAKPYSLWGCSGFPACKAKALTDAGGTPVFNAKDLD